MHTISCIYHAMPLGSHASGDALDYTLDYSRGCCLLSNKLIDLFVSFMKYKVAASKVAIFAELVSFLHSTPGLCQLPCPSCTYVRHPQCYSVTLIKTHLFLSAYAFTHIQIFIITMAFAAFSCHILLSYKLPDGQVQMAACQSVVLCRRMLMIFCGSGSTKLMTFTRGCSKLNSQRARCPLTPHASLTELKADSAIAVALHGQHLAA